MCRPPEDVDVEIHLIGDHPHIIIAPSGHPLARDFGLSAADLAHETFLTREQGSGTRMLMEQLFLTTELQPRIGMEMSSNETIKQAVIAGLGIALISAHTVATELEDGRLVSLNVAMVCSAAKRQGTLAASAGLDYLSIEGARFLPGASTVSP
jgi:LysR family transcriptional regulator for metE and metH